MNLPFAARCVCIRVFYYHHNHRRWWWCLYIVHPTPLIEPLSFAVYFHLFLDLIPSHLRAPLPFHIPYMCCVLCARFALGVLFARVKRTKNDYPFKRQPHALTKFIINTISTETYSAGYTSRTHTHTTLHPTIIIVITIIPATPL